MNIIGKIFSVPSMLICIMLLIAPGIDAKSYNKNDVKAFKSAYSLILNEEWKKAYGEFESFITKYSKSHYLDDALFWQCYCREKMGQKPEQVFSCYTDFIKKYKRSKWTDDARSNVIRIGHQLAKDGKKEYIDIIKAFEENQNADVRLAALSALEDIGDQRSMDTIIEMYDTSSDVKLKRRIISILEDFKNPGAYTKIKSIALTEKNPKLRRRAIDTLPDMNSPETISVLMKIVKSDADMSVKRQALEAMEDVKTSSSKNSSEALKALVEVVNTPGDVKLRKRAISSIEDFETAEAEKVLYNMSINLKEDALACEAVESLADMVKRSNPDKLMEVYRKNRRFKVRKEVINNIEDLKSFHGIPMLVKLAETEKDPHLLIEIIDGLEDYNRDEPIPLLQKFAIESKNLKVRKAAVDALERIGSAKASEALKKILKAK